MPSSPTKDMGRVETAHEKVTYNHKHENEHLMENLSTDMAKQGVKSTVVIPITRTGVIALTVVR